MNSRPILTDQNDADLIAAGCPHPRPGHLTDYRQAQRAAHYRLGRKLGYWLIVALAVILVALAACLW